MKILVVLFVIAVILYSVVLIKNAFIEYGRNEDDKNDYK